MKNKLGQRSWFFMLPLFLLLAGSAAAAQFSALMMIKDGDRVVSGRIYVQDGKMRQEFTDAEGQTVTIVRPDQKVIWFIMPLERAYVEMPLKGKASGAVHPDSQGDPDQAPGGQRDGERLRGGKI